MCLTADIPFNPEDLRVEETVEHAFSLLIASVNHILASLLMVQNGIIAL